MPGDTPHAAVKAFVATLNRAAACVTQSIIVQGGHDPAHGPYVLFFRPDPIVHLGGTHDLSLSFAQGYTLVQPEGDSGPWKVRTTEYIYEILLPRGRQLLAYHWHPRGRSPATWPHIHLRSHTEPVDLTKAHPPTGRVSFESLLRLAIEDLGVPVRPARETTWVAILAEAEAASWNYSSWGAPPAPDDSPPQTVATRATPGARQRRGHRTRRR